MMAKDAMRKREKAAEKRREAEEAWIKDEIDAHSFDDLKDEDIEEVLAQVPEERREECRSWARDARRVAATNVEDAHNL